MSNEPGTKSKADKLFYPKGAQLALITDVLIKHLNVNFSQPRVIHYRKLFTPGYDFPSQARDRSKTGSRSEREKHPSIPSAVCKHLAGICKTFKGHPDSIQGMRIEGPLMVVPGSTGTESYP